MPPPPATVNGDHFSRYLVKAHCDFLAHGGIRPPEDFVKYAFGRTDRRPVFFYFIDADSGGSWISRPDTVAFDWIPTIGGCEIHCLGPRFLLTLSQQSGRFYGVATLCFSTRFNHYEVHFRPPVEDPLLSGGQML
jgi:hypothetical protein